MAEQNETTYETTKQLMAKLNVAELKMPVFIGKAVKLRLWLDYMKVPVSEWLRYLLDKKKETELG